MGRALAWSLVAIIIIVCALIVIPTVSLWIARLLERKQQ